MPATPQQLHAAQAAQAAAAHDGRPQVRLIAGPGTGKSFTIEERVSWLLQNHTPPQSVFAISFTNASAQDLRLRIQQHCQSQNLDATNVSVTTMHSLALRVLRAAGLLQQYPAFPLVVDQWELENVVDAEFRHSHSVSKQRCRDVRRDHEAMWSTGAINPPNFIPPAPPITTLERGNFANLAVSIGQVYSCILPGAIVRECVRQIGAGTVDPNELLSITHLIVDEYQDLNPMDLEFIDAIIQRGANTFVAGDDDQSIYSFRFALPQGIQNFTTAHPACGNHALTTCFRCATDILAAASAVISGYPSANRIPKTLVSVYAQSNPPVAGTVLRSIFQSGAEEARAVATSCAALIAAGMPASEILALISDRNLLEDAICTALGGANVPYEQRSDEGIITTGEGRLLFAFLRITCNPDDYLAHRTLLGLLPGVGIGTCVGIKDKTIGNNLNYKALFGQALPAGVFTTREARAISRVSAVVSQLYIWAGTDDLSTRRADIVTLAGTFGPAAVSVISNLLASLPSSLTIAELREFISTSSDEVRFQLLSEAYQREGSAPPASAVPPARVRVMTMHGAKGLSARAVFIPGLEEDVFPGPRRRPYPGLIQEAARLLYVSITRARAACFMSFARRRVVYGRLTPHAPSRFNAATGGTFVQAGGGLTPTLAARVVADCAQL